MSDILDQWKAEAKEELEIGLHLLTLHAKREIALIDLLRKKDGKLKLVGGSGVIECPGCNALIKKIGEALALTEELK